MFTLRQGYLHATIAAVMLLLVMAAVTFCLHPIVGTGGVATGWILGSVMMVWNFVAVPWRVRVMNERLAEWQRQNESRPDSGGKS